MYLNEKEQVCKYNKKPNGEILSRISRKTGVTERNPSGVERDFLMKMFIKEDLSMSGHLPGWIVSERF
jgi:hypothetical protein